MKAILSLDSLFIEVSYHCIFFIQKHISKPKEIYQIFYKYSLLMRSIKIETLARFIF